MTDVQLENLFHNLEEKNMVAPLRQAHAARASGKPKTSADHECAEAIALQERWAAWLEEREQLQHAVKRGEECLDLARKELTTLRARLEDWPTYERICGVNPLADYVQEIAAKERVAAFLPNWLRRQGQRLTSLNRQLETCARQNGLEHLL